MGRASMRALKRMNKEFAELTKLGKKYDRETDPEKKEALKKEIDERCNAFKTSFKADEAAITAELAAEADAAEDDPGKDLLDSDS